MLSYISVHNVATSSCIHAFCNLMYLLTCACLALATSFGSCEPQPQEMFPLPVFIHNLNHVSVFLYLYLCLSCVSLACLTLVALSPYLECWLINRHNTLYSCLSYLVTYSKGTSPVQQIWRWAGCILVGFPTTVTLVLPTRPLFSPSRSKKQNLTAYLQ